MKWLSEKIIKIYHFFGPILSLCFIVTLIVAIIIAIHTQIPIERHGLGLSQLPGSGTYTPLPPTPWYQNINMGSIVGTIITHILLIAFGMSFLYFILGIVRHFVTPSKEIKGNSVKVLLLRGSIGMILAVLFFRPFF